MHSLYRRSLRAAALAVESQRAWTTKYVRLRFRDDALVRGGGAETLGRRMREAEDELDRFLSTLQKTGRVDGEAADKLRSSAAAAATQPPLQPPAPPVQAHSAAPVQSAAPIVPAYEWDENTVGAWLQGIGLGHHAAAFASHRVDGRLLLRLDDEDLSEELGVASRLERKRVLTQLEKLRSEQALAGS